VDTLDNDGTDGREDAGVERCFAGGLCGRCYTSPYENALICEGEGVALRAPVRMVGLKIACARALLGWELSVRLKKRAGACLCGEKEGGG